MCVVDDGMRSKSHHFVQAHRRVISDMYALLGCPGLHLTSRAYVGEGPGVFDASLVRRAQRAWR